MSQGRDTDEPIGDQVPVADAVDQRRAIGEHRELSEDVQPTELDEIAAEEDVPEDANPADWQDQLTSAETGVDEWDTDVE